MQRGVSRIVVYANHEPARRWIEEELADLGCAYYFAVSVADAFSALGDAPSQVLAIDIDALEVDELISLQVLSDSGLSRVFIGLGNVTEQLRTALRITHEVPRPFGSERLRSIITELDTRTTGPVRVVHE